MYADFLTAVCTPGELKKLPPGVRAAVYTYVTGADGRLRRYSAAARRGDLAILTPGGDFPPQTAALLIAELRRTGAAGLLADVEDAEPKLRESLTALCAELDKAGLPLYIPASCAVPGAIVIESAAVTAGSYRLRLSELAARYPGGYAVDIEPLCADFRLPSSGRGEALGREGLSELLAASLLTYYSGALCARYFTYRRGGETHFVVYDDESTLREKLRLAEAGGAKAAFTPYESVAPWLPGLIEAPR